jgi:hypothetical protein
MNIPEGIININFLDNNGTVLGSQQGLMMTYHHQTFVFTAFDTVQTHFTHGKFANFVYNDKNFEMISSRYVYPYYIRIWEICETNINNATDMNINFPNKNHYINNIKVDEIKSIEYNGWHIALPPVHMHQIKNIWDLGSVIHLKNKITGMVISHLDDTSLVISMYFIKKIIQGGDLNYANLYYGINISNNQFYIQYDWDIYSNSEKLEKNDILVEIDNHILKYEMYDDKIKEYVSIDTWITLQYFESDELNIKIIRNNRIMNVKIPRIPIHNILQIKYYSLDSSELSFESMKVNNGVERYDSYRNELKLNPKKMFN